MTRMTNVGQDLPELTKDPEPINMISSAVNTQVRQMYNASNSLERVCAASMLGLHSRLLKFSQ